MIKKALILIVPLLAFLGGSTAGAMLKGDGTSRNEHVGEASVTSKDGHAESKTVSAEDHASPSESDGHDTPPPAKGAETHDDSEGHKAKTTAGWFGFPSQFFVPVVRNGRTQSIMILSLSLQVTPGTEGTIASQEHQLRDAILRRLMIHANTGGFDGNFTSDLQSRMLREALLTAAQDIAGADIIAILIEAIARQEG